VVRSESNKVRKRFPALRKKKERHAEASGIEAKKEMALHTIEDTKKKRRGERDGGRSLLEAEGLAHAVAGKNRLSLPVRGRGEGALSERKKERTP